MARMGAKTTVLSTPLSVDLCRQRISQAESNPSSGLVSRDLRTLIDVVDCGNCFELRHRVEPAVFLGTVSQSAKGSVIRGEITVPARVIYRFGLGLALVVSLMMVGASAYDVLFGTHLLRVRSVGELTPGHPANLEQHFGTLLLVPLLAIPMIWFFYPKARGVSSNVRNDLLEFLAQLFELTNACPPNEPPANRKLE